MIISVFDKEVKKTLENPEKQQIFQALCHLNEMKTYGLNIVPLFF